MRITDVMRITEVMRKTKVKKRLDGKANTKLLAKAHL